MYLKGFIISIIIMLTYSGLLFSQPFEKDLAVTEILPKVASGFGLWGDYDGDGDLDIILSGQNTIDTLLNIYNNNGMGYNMIISDFIPLDNSNISWCDYDNDGDLDFLSTGALLSGNEATANAILYQNFGNDQFEIADADLQGILSGVSAWADLDNDGDQDVIMIGDKGGEGVTRIYQNESDGQFSLVNNNLLKIYKGDIALGDYDNDQDIDIALIGQYKDLQGSEFKTLNLYKNEGNFDFTEVYSGFIGMSESNIKFGDYDADGDLDILANGSTDAPTHLVYIYQNEGNDIFQSIGIEIFGTVNGTVEWGDYDNDGDLDFILTGTPSYSDDPITEIYRNINTNLFNKENNQDLPNVYNSSSQWGDYDNDGDLDIILTGNSAEGDDHIADVFRNQNEFTNTPPTSPTGLQSNLEGNEVTLYWLPSNDMETQSTGLTYNLRVGQNPLGLEIVSPLSNNNGTRLIQCSGNAGQNKSWHLKNLEPGIYYWSVQAIDNNFQGSAFAEEGTFEIISTGYINNPSNEVVVIKNYPNPFSDLTYFKFEMPFENEQEIFITDQYGKTVRKFNNNRQNNKINTILWDGKNDAGEFLINGTYFFILEDSGLRHSCKTIILK